MKLMNSDTHSCTHSFASLDILAVAGTDDFMIRETFAIYARESSVEVFGDDSFVRHRRRRRQGEDGMDGCEIMYVYIAPYFEHKNMERRAETQTYGEKPVLFPIFANLLFSNRCWLWCFGYDSRA